MLLPRKFVRITRGQSYPPVSLTDIAGFQKIPSGRSLPPRRLLDGVIEGVRDGGNKSGVPTPFGQVVFDRGYMGKCLVFVTAMGIMPANIDNESTHLKKTEPGDLIIMAAFGWCDEARAREWKPKVVLVDENNRMIRPAPELQAAS